MSGFQITITDAGRAALINAQNNGTVAFTLSQVGVSTQHIAANLAGLTQLPNERKRLATMAGDVVADDTLHVTIRDEGDDAYALRSFGIYTSAGVLFAVYSQTDPILEKSAAAMLLLAIDARLVALGTAMVEFGPAGFTLPPASETVAGLVEIATDAEVDAGIDPWRVITARTLKRALGALSGFALKGHQHDAGDTTSGVFHVGRIPALDMSKITGLAIALAGKAAEIHTHTINQILGLTEALAGKAAATHQHIADDIVAGVLAVGRIPALGMEKITGLAVALAAKAGLDGPDFTGIVRLPSQTLFKKEAPGTAEGGQLQLERPDQSTLAGDIVIDVNGGNVRVYERAAPFRGFTIPIAEMANGVGSSPWTNTNFNPETKATLGANALFYDVIAARSENDGVYFFGNTAGRWLAYVNGRFELVGNGGLTVNGYQAWTAENLRPATAADAAAGTAADRFLTPAALWSFARSIGPSGYQQIPGTNLIIQWGVQAATVPEGPVDTFLPVAFGGGCLFAAGTPRNASGVVTMDYYMQVMGRWQDRITWYANRANGGAGNLTGFEWMAIGLATGNPDPVFNSGGGSGGGGGGGGGELNPEQ